MGFTSLFLSALVLATATMSEPAGLDAAAASMVTAQAQHKELLLNYASEDHKLSARTAIKGDKYRWPGGIIPYRIDSTYTDKQKETIRLAMKDIQHHTCVRFIHRRKNDKDYLSVENGTGCATPVGRRGGKQVVTLDVESCIQHGVIMHELMHALGFWHEHARHDRDKHVEIHEENIESGAERNFNKHTRNKEDTLGTPYDLESVMHYHPHAFTKSSDEKNEDKTIVPKKSGAKIGQRKKLSHWDIVRINRMYCQNIEGYMF